MGEEVRVLSTCTRRLDKDGRGGGEGFVKRESRWERGEVEKGRLLSACTRRLKKDGRGGGDGFDNRESGWVSVRERRGCTLIVSARWRLGKRGLVDGRSERETFRGGWREGRRS